MAQRQRRDGRQQLARAIKDFNGNRTEFAAERGMSVEQLRHIDSGRRPPTVEQAIAFEDKDGIPIRSWRFS